MAQFPPHCQLSLCRHIQKKAAHYRRREHITLSNCLWRQLSGAPGHPCVPTSSLFTSSLTASLTSDTYTCQMLPYPPDCFRGSNKGFPRKAESNTFKRGWLAGESSRLAETPFLTQPPGCPRRTWPGPDEGRRTAGPSTTRKGKEKVWPSWGPCRAHPGPRRRSESPRESRTSRQKQGQETSPHPGIETGALGASGANTRSGAKRL